MELDLNARYKVADNDGVAWYLVGYKKEWTEEWYEDVGTQSMSDYIYHEPEEIEDRTKVIAIMVGDDREFTFDIEDLIKLDDEDYCHECGQIGCTADGR